MATSSITITALAATPTLRGNKLVAAVSAIGPAANIPTLMLDNVEFFSSTTNDFTTASKVGEGNPEFLHAGLIEEQTYYYWAKPRAVNGSYGAVFPVSPAGGVACTAIGMSGLAFGLANGKITATANSPSSNNLTIALKTAAGNDPSASDPIYVAFRNVTQGTGGYVIRQVTAELSLVLSNGSTLSTINNTPFRVRVALFDDGGTLRLAAIVNSSSNGTLYPALETGIASATAEGGAGAADAIGVFYAGAAIISKPYRLIAALDWNSGLATAGAWSADPSVIHPAYASILTPGALLQERSYADLSFSGSTTAVIPLDNTKPQSGEGSAYVTETLTPQSPCSIFDIRCEINVSHSAGSEVILALFRDAGSDAIATGLTNLSAANKPGRVILNYRVQAGDAAARDYKFRIGGAQAGTLTINGISGATTLGSILANAVSIRELAG